MTVDHDYTDQLNQLIQIVTHIDSVVQTIGWISAGVICCVIVATTWRG